MSKKEKLDKYYTNMEVVNLIIGALPQDRFYIEPSAGDGAFLSILPNNRWLAFDIAPEGCGIVEADFLNLNLNQIPDEEKGNIVCIGNPPFGKNSSLAIKFFNKSAEFAEEIRFIVPKTFRKQSIHNKLNLYFHLISDTELPKNSFLLNGTQYDVPCCYQIWEKRKYKREKINFEDSNLIEFVGKNDNPDVAIRRVGGRAGQVLDGLDYSESSTYFIKIKNKKVTKLLNDLDIKTTRNNTAGVRSISKLELLRAIKEKLK